MIKKGAPGGPKARWGSRPNGLPAFILGAIRSRLCVILQKCYRICAFSDKQIHFLQKMFMVSIFLFFSFSGISPASFVVMHNFNLLFLSILIDLSLDGGGGR